MLDNGSYSQMESEALEAQLILLYYLQVPNSGSLHFFNSVTPEILEKNVVIHMKKNAAFLQSLHL